jgi:hypothetical protein
MSPAAASPLVTQASAALFYGVVAILQTVAIKALLSTYEFHASFLLFATQQAAGFAFTVVVLLVFGGRACKGVEVPRFDWDVFKQCVEWCRRTHAAQLRRARRAPVGASAPAARCPPAPPPAPPP